jgi:hypothetical protein
MKKLKDLAQLMKSSLQMRRSVVSSFVMENTDHNQTPPAESSAPSTHPSSAHDAAADAGTAGEATETGAPQGAPADGKGRVNFLRQLLANLFGGLRLAVGLPTAPERFFATPLALALLALTDFLVNLGLSYLLVGRSGFFAYAAVSSFYFHLPLLLFFGYLAGRLLSRPSLVLVIPVALVALSIPIELSHAVLERVMQMRQIGWLEDYLFAPHYYRFFSWWIVAALIFLLRLRQAPVANRIAAGLIFIALVVMPLWFFPRGDLWVSSSEGSESGQLHLTDEVLAAQQRLLDRELDELLPGREGKADLYFLGFAGDASQDVFLKEATSAQRIFDQRFGTTRRSLLLVNNPKTATTLPFATAPNLEQALYRLGQVMNRDEDVLFLYFTSHGSREHELTVNNPPLELGGLTPEQLRRMLKKSGITWKVLVVSACYSGGFVDPLKDEHSLIITAADAVNSSFGCGYGEKFTWFGQAFLDDALRRTFSFTAAFERARKTIRQWEKEQGETPSNPQIWVGKAMQKKLPELEKLLAKRSGE